jgi:multisubunit Na+/H+ antiporter MnhB subunit
MSGDIYPKAKALVPGILRSLSSIVLILIAAACVYLSFAAMEASRDTWWRFWTIYGVVGLSCLLGAGWMLRRSSFVSFHWKAKQAGIRSSGGDPLPD